MRTFRTRSSFHFPSPGFSAVRAWREVGYCATLEGDSQANNARPRYSSAVPGWEEGGGGICSGSFYGNRDGQCAAPTALLRRSLRFALARDGSASFLREGRTTTPISR